MKENNEDETSFSIFMYFLPNLFCVHIFLSCGSEMLRDFPLTCYGIGAESLAPSFRTRSLLALSVLSSAIF